MQIYLQLHYHHLVNSSEKHIFSKAADKDAECLLNTSRAQLNVNILFQYMK